MKYTAVFFNVQFCSFICLNQYKCLVFVLILAVKYGYRLVILSICIRQSCTLYLAFVTIFYQFTNQTRPIIYSIKLVG